MKTPGSSYQQDASGQWWYYPAEGSRTRAHVKTCEECREEYVVNVFHRGTSRFCSRQCSMRHTGRSYDQYGPRHPKWKGGRKILSNGYVRVWLSSEDRKKYGVRRDILEHRLVMSEHLGRPLLKTESVHHKNGDRTDNRIENLELRARSHGPGATKPHCPTCTCFDG
jgi:hypothetical protein